MQTYDPIEFFRPARVRGNTIEERIASLKRTAEKVVSDSEGDTSSYRTGYAGVHRDILDRIDCEDIEDAEAELNSFYNWYSATGLDHRGMIEEPGRYDAIGRILAELEVVLSLEVNDV
jgi:hypothetical protein